MKSSAEAVKTSTKYNGAISGTSDNVGGTYCFRRSVKSLKTGNESEKSVQEEDSSLSLDSKQLKLDLEYEQINILDNSAAKHKLSVRPKRRHADSRQTTFSTSETDRCFTRTSEDLFQEVSDSKHHQSNHEDRMSEIRCKREAVVNELLETEVEFGRDLQYVVDHYLKPSDEFTVPRIVWDNINVIFSNLQQISIFHNTTLLEGIKYYSDEPRMLGKTFLRLERDFDKHTAYCRDEPLAQEFLDENLEATEYFEVLSQKLGDGKNISEYLKLPVQRINDYQVLLKDLVKYSDKLGENTYDLQRALDLMLAIPQRANDNKFLSNIEGFHGNIHKLGRLLKHDWFNVVSGTKSKERYCFLFKGHIIICKVKKITEDRSVFILKHLISFSEVKIRNYPDENTFEIFGADSKSDETCIKVIARKENSKSSWISEIQKHVPEVFNIETKTAENVCSKPVEEPTEESQTEISVQNKESNQIRNENFSRVENNLIEERTEKSEIMNRRLSTRRSYKAYEESYSVSSSQREVSYSATHSSASATKRFSSASLYDSRIEASADYESSSVRVYSSSARAISDRSSSLTGSTRLSIKSGEKPVFTRTIGGLNLEPGDTAVFECQLESDVQVTWLKDNKVLDDKLADRVVRSSSDDGTHRLELQHVTELDSGVYTAMAQSNDSIATCTAQLLVHRISEEEKQRRMEPNAPIFTVKLKDTELLANTNFRFMVKVKGNPNPDVRFYKDDIPIRRSDEHIKIINEKADVGFYELVITDVQPHHAGIYSCKATNINGEAHCEGTITVTDHKTVFAGLENEILLTPGEKPSFTWLKDGKPFDPDERFKVLLGNEDDSLALIFQHVKPDDAGLYTCVASTSTGKISCSAELSVQGSVVPLAKEPERPKILYEEKTCEATIGGSAMLEAKVKGFPKPDVKWYHEGEEIKASGRFKFLYEDQETMTLVIKNVNPRDGGSYKIIARNELGEEVSELNLTVKGAPKIIKKMEDVNVKQNGVIKITVGVEGSPVPDVKWYKNGKELKETEKVKIIKETKEEYTLIIEKATGTDSGSYSIVASNEINQCTDSCQVKVSGAPVIIKKLGENVQVSEGEEIIYEIKISSESTPKVKWMKDGMEISGEDKKTRITVRGDVYELKILNADAKDTAEYSVEISNEFGTSTDKSKATVTSKTCAPVVKKGLEDTVAKEGDSNVEFSVEISAYPKPKIRWYLGDTEITEKRIEYTKVEEDDKYKLVLKKVTTELRGTYTCKIENDYGSAETSCQLIIHSKPTFTKQLKSKLTVDEGAELTLQIECEGCPEPEITWFKDGQEVRTDAHIKITRDLHRSESYSMTLTLIQASDGGEYEARASNSMGSATTKTYVEVISKVTETSVEEGTFAVKQEPLEASQKAVVAEEGVEKKSTVPEPTKTRVIFVETEWTDLKVEEIDNSYAEEKSVTQGIVEEVLDSENEHTFHKLIVNRGVSIVSLSEDDRTLSRNNSGIDLDEKNELDEEEISGKKIKCESDNRGNQPEESDLKTSLKNANVGETEESPEDDFEKSIKNEKRREVTVDNSEECDIASNKQGTEHKLEVPFWDDKKEEKDFWETIDDEKKSTEHYVTPLKKLSEDKLENDFWASIKNETADEIHILKSTDTVIRKTPKVVTENNIQKSFEEIEDDFRASVKSDKEANLEDYSHSCEQNTAESYAQKPISENQGEKGESKLETDFWESISEPNELKCIKPLKKEQNTDENNYSQTPDSVNEKKPINVEKILAKRNSLLEEKDLEKPEIFEKEMNWERKSTNRQTLLEEDLRKPEKCEEETNREEKLQKRKDLFEERDLEKSHEQFKKEINFGKESALVEENQVEEENFWAKLYEGEKSKYKEISANSRLEVLERHALRKETTYTKAYSRDGKSEEVDLAIEDLKHTAEISVEEAKGKSETSDFGNLSPNITKKQNYEAEDVNSPESYDFWSSQESEEVKSIPNRKVANESENNVTKSSSVVELYSVEKASRDESNFTTSPKSANGKPLKADEDDFWSTLTKEEKPEVPEKSCTSKAEEGDLRTSPKISEKTKINQSDSLPEKEQKVEMFEAPHKKLSVNKLEKPLEQNAGKDECPKENGYIQKSEPHDDAEPESDSEDDPAVRALLKRIQKQRSVLEEILTKEAESQKEDTTQQKPIFKNPLKNITCTTNDVAAFTCKIAANPEPEIIWLKDGKEIKIDNIKIKSTLEEVDKNASEYSCTLKITKPGSADAGLYMVKAKNKYGYGESDASLTIQIPEEKPEIKNLKDVTVNSEENAEFEAEVISALTLVVKWLNKNGIELKPDDRIMITEDKTTGIYKLTIKEAKVDDAGEYTLVATNDSGETTHAVKLNVTDKAVKQKPVFKEPLEDQNCTENETATFKCVISANPEPEVTWTLNGKEVKVDGNKIKVETSVKESDQSAPEYTYVLKILDSSSADDGLYMAKAKNKYGYDESSASLTIQVPEDTRPHIRNLKDVTVVPGDDATFEVEVISTLTVIVVWVNKNGEKIKADDKFIITEDKSKNIYKLIIKNTKAEDAGEFKVVATNDSGERSQAAKLFVTGERPSIVKPIEDTRIKDGTDADFLVRCNGIPKPKVKWYKNGHEISSSDRISISTQSEGQVSSLMSIVKFRADDEGQYKVVATNSVGSVDNEFKLKLVQLPPAIEKGLPRSEEVDEGEVLELKCKLSGSPIPQVAWLKDGEPLVPSDRVKITIMPDGLVKLCIENVKPNDSGAYSIKAENPNGQVAGNCAVAVQPKSCKPKIIDNLKDCKAEVGKPLKLEAKIMCFPAPEVKWFKDGKPLRPSQVAVQSFNENDGTLELMIKSVKPEDAGLYSVKVSNKLGEVAEEAKVDVIKPQEKPKFEANMMPVSVVEGFPARFDVKVTGNPKPVVKWFHNGKEIVPNGEHFIVKEELDGTSSLLIDKASPEDVGEYMARAINDEGEASSKADLNVLAKKTEKEEMEPMFIRPLANLAVQEDDQLVLSAPIAGNPVPEVTWEKDGNSLLSDDRVLLTCDGKKVNLEIKNCKPSDKGLYICYLKNPLGEAKSKANVDVKKIYTEPVFVEKFKDTKEVQNKDVKFVARIIGNPKPEAEWFLNGELIKEGEKYQIRCEGDKYSLLVRDSKPEDKGLYRCSAFNRAGRADCVASLDVVQKIETQQHAEPPFFLKKISDCDIYKGMTAKFTACVTGIPEPEFEWFRNDEKLQPSSRIKMESQENGLIRLTITGVDDVDIGTYRVRIFNPHGEAECSAKLICDVLEPRSKKAIADKEERKDKTQGGIPVGLSDKPIISRMTDRHLTLSWKPYIPPGPSTPVTYIVEMCKQPDGDWFTVRRGIKSCACDIRNLEPFQDYKFRVRIENKYGISEPSPFAETYRHKIIPDPPKFVPYLSPGIDFRPETSPYFPKDFDIDRPPHDRYEQAPKFLRQEHETQYGIKNQNSNLFWFVYGYPKPIMSYYFNDEPIELGGRYDCSYTRNGQATLFINKMLDRDVGVYEAVAKNEHGEARQRVRLEIAEYPTFIQRPEESYIMLRGSGQITARIVGVPYPEIKWYKDWQSLAPSSRIKIQQIAPDTVMLTINDAILKDEGLYSVSATNVAGSVSSSAMVHIEEQEEAYKWATYDGGLNIKTRPEPYSNYYDIGDELGRGTQGVTYHAVERRSGQNYAAKFMHGRSDLKFFMVNELNIMNSLNHRKLIRLHDSFEVKNLLVLVTELAGGGGLLEWLIKQTYTTEYEIAEFIRQILWGLEYMHSNGYAHLSLTLNDLLLSRPDGDDIKICDFGLSRKILHNNLMSLNYGMPEYVAPEVVKGEGVSYSADLWSLGIITYILLSGMSPFKGLNDRETLTRVQKGIWNFEDCFSNISSEAKDFISKLLAYKPGDRMDAKTALRHPWLERAGQLPSDAYKIKLDNLKDYHNSLKSWYKNANCRTWYRRQPLETAFSHPSKMVYPPAKDYTPEPDLEAVGTTRQLNGRPTGDVAIPTREPLNYEVGDFKSESHYQYGPDTYLLQLRDVDLPCRLRHYMKVAADREHSFYSEPPEKHLDWRTPIIRERRKFTDIMDEEIDDERQQRIKQYGSDDIYSLRRLKHEISCRSDGHAEAEAMLEYKREGHVPFFREKPQNLAIIQNQPAEISCMVVGDPDPVVQWFKNDLVLAETCRIKMRTDVNKRYYLKFEPALQLDVGVYKVVARNKVGQSIARMRIALATVPLSPDPPELVEASDTEVILKWKQQCDDVFTPVLCYSLQYKQTESEEWFDVCKHIDHEFWLVKNLQPSTSYVFRLSSKNCVGWSAPGIPSDVINTKELGAPKVNISDTQRLLQSQIESKMEGEGAAEETKEVLNYSVEETPLEWSADSNVDAKYNFTSEIFKGHFSIAVKGRDKSSNQEIAAKFLEVNSDTEKFVAHEFDIFKGLRHERIVTLLSAIRPAPNIAIFIMEKLQGADILSYFAARQEYNEDMLVTAFSQVLDGLQYLHWRGYCHLDIQPDNIVLSSVRSLQVKLVDFGSVQKVSKLGTVVSGPITEYTAPEIICNESAFPQTDIWSLGTLMYVLLSGVSPFKGETQEEMKENITFVRYRFEHLYKDITQEATRFLMQIFKRTPSKRPTVDECYEARWFLSSEHMIKKRLKATFPGHRLKKYSEAYHNEKSGKGLALGELAKAFGEKVLRRSNSVQEELITF